MSSTIKVNNISNLAGDDSGIDLSTNDQVIIKTANTTAVTINASQNVALAGNQTIAGNATVAGTLGVTGTISGTDMQLLHTTTVSSNVGQVQLNGHFTSAFKNYKIIGSNVHTETDNINMNLKFMSGGSVLTGSYHRSCYYKIESNSASIAIVVEQTDTEFAKVLGQQIGNATGENANFEITLYDPLATDNFKAFSSKANVIHPDGNSLFLQAEGFYNNGQSALSGIEIDPASGNIASGIFKLYGLR